eukprot:8809314-Pyramimonas_sp.AAC.1
MRANAYPGGFAQHCGGCQHRDHHDVEENTDQQICTPANRKVSAASTDRNPKVWGTIDFSSGEFAS